MSLWKIILNRYHTQKKTFKKTERDKSIYKYIKIVEMD